MEVAGRVLQGLRRGRRLEVGMARGVSGDDRNRGPADEDDLVVVFDDVVGMGTDARVELVARRRPAPHLARLGLDSNQDGA